MSYTCFANYNIQGSPKKDQEKIQSKKARNNLNIINSKENMNQKTKTSKIVLDNSKASSSEINFMRSYFIPPLRNKVNSFKSINNGSKRMAIKRDFRNLKHSNIFSNDSVHQNLQDQKKKCSNGKIKISITSVIDQLRQTCFSK